MFGPNLEEIKGAVTEAVTEAVEEALNNGEDSHATKLKLEKEVTDLKRQIAELEHKKGLEEKEIQHLVKMKEEKITIETKRKELELQERFMKDTAELQKKFHESTVALLEKHSEKFQKTYEEIMKRLPNVNMTIRQEQVGNGNG